MKRNLIGCVAAAAFLALFGVIYESFSHGVYSGYMIGAFAIPLGLGALPYGVLFAVKKDPGRIFINLWNAGIAAMSVGSVFRGVLEIYGTTNSLSVVYPIAGGILLAAGFLAGCVRIGKKTDFSEKN